LGNIFQEENFMSTLSTQQLNERIWAIIASDAQTIAWFVMNYSYEVEKVLFWTQDKAQRLEISQLCLWHALSYQNDRRFCLSDSLRRFARTVHPANMNKSDLAMDFDQIPEEVKKLSQKVITEILTDSDKVEFIDIEFDGPQAALAHVASKILAKYEVVVKAEIVERGARLLPLDSFLVKFTLESDHNFKIWNCVDQPYKGRLRDSNLHTTPVYHPCYSGSKRHGLINGATDSYIQSKTIDNLYSPEEARTEAASGRIWGSTWGPMKHPFYAEGKTLSMDVDCFHILSAKGVEEIYNALTSALKLNGWFMEVSGGFNSPYEYALNVRNPNLEHRARGSEQNVIWEYRTLEREGKLEGSFVPPWFFKEKWLQMYPESL